MADKNRTIIFGGKTVALVGSELKAGDAAPDFTVIDNSLTEVSLAKFRGQVLIIASVPSLETGVCDRETRTFNEKAAQLGSKAQILTISMDLPFTQKRWCGAAGIDRVTTLSDHRSGSFGTAYGVLIQDLRLLARAVFVIDSGGVIRHIELLSDAGKEPNYEATIQAAQKLL